mmetsp:Transcript_6087/g.17279  ORF Transcript_6087/g.17279 Transcript_6087/m.17279 type:complete len:187 (+) Transcript_6087:477-1037(+)
MRTENIMTTGSIKHDQQKREQEPDDGPLLNVDVALSNLFLANGCFFRWSMIWTRARIPNQASNCQKYQGEGKTVEEKPILLKMDIIEGTSSSMLMIMTMTMIMIICSVMIRIITARLEVTRLMNEMTEHVVVPSHHSPSHEYQPIAKHGPCPSVVTDDEHHDTEVEAFPIHKMFQLCTQLLQNANE